MKPTLFSIIKTSIEEYFSITNLEELNVLIDSQETCGLLITDEIPSNSNLGNYLPDECCHGYVINNNDLFYIDRDNQICKKILEDNADLIQKIKKRVCFEDETHCILLPSQLAEVKKISGHSPKQPFCTLKLKDNDIEYKIYKGNWQKIDGDQSLHPIIKYLYPAIEKFNRKYSQKNNLWQRINHFFSSPQENFPNTEKQDKAPFSIPARRESWFLLPFIWLNKALRFILAPIFLNNFIIKQTVGRIIAAIANFGNPHYQTEPETVGNILGPIIFPGGFKQPQIFDNGQIILDPVLSRQYHALYHFEALKNNENNHIVYEGQRYHEFSIPMQDGYHNDGIEGENALASQKITAGKTNEVLHLVWFNGNGGCYQQNVNEMTQYLTALQQRQIPAKITCFNYPGVLTLDPPPKNGQLLIDYGIAHVERLKSKGVPPENIVLHGTSLGGCIATNVMGFYQNSGQSLGGLNISRTFSSTTNVGLSYVKKIPYIGKLLAILLRPVLDFGLWGTQWNFNTAKPFVTIPARNKFYTTALTPRDIKNAYDKANLPILDDDVLIDYASLHRSWLLKIYRWLAKNFGLFGIDKEHYREMNANTKLLPTITPIDKAIDVSETIAGKLSHLHCAHADIDYSLKRVTKNQGFQLLVRQPAAHPDSEKKVQSKAKYVANGETVYIPVSEHSLFSKNIEFLRHCAMQNQVIEKSDSNFVKFFNQNENDSDSLEKVSSAVLSLMKLIP